MNTITMHNGVSLLQTDPDTLAQLRPRVAYRERMLPPIHVQRVIKRFFAEETGRSKHRAHQQLFESEEAGALWGMGWGANRLTESQVTAVARTRGFWDGWVPQVTTNGWFQSGLVPMVQRVMQLHLQQPCQVIDARQRPLASKRTYPAPPLWDHQEEAIQAFWNAGGRGVMDVPPRCGKTRIAIAIVCALALPTLVVVPTKELVNQTVARFREFLPEHQAMGVTGGRQSAKRQRLLNQAMVWVATPGTAAGPRPKMPKGVTAPRKGMAGIDSRKLLVVDEFHHSAAKLWQDISMTARNAFFRLGLTGTHYRADGKDLAMHGVLSRCIYKRTVGDMVRLGRLVPAKVAMLRVAGEVAADGYALYADGVAGHEYRNALAAWAAQHLISQGKRVLVLGKEKAHCRALAAAIGYGAVQVDGEDNAKVRPALEALQSRITPCVVGTSVIGEGVDVPAADAMVYVAGGRSEVKHVQDYFRVLTAGSGKSHGLIVDFADNHNEKLVTTAAHRLANYRQEGAFESEVVDPIHFPSWLNRQAA
jgi:superfamily II DNA or RNA helicase